MQYILCPFCLKRHGIKVGDLCPDALCEIPEIYLRDYQSVPPLSLATVGLSHHGKTTFLSALTLLLENIGIAWKDTNHKYLDDYTRSTIRHFRSSAYQGKSPESTDLLSRPQPLLIHVYGLQGLGNRCSIIYDMAGEMLESPNHNTPYYSILKEVNTIWFVVSLADLSEDRSGRTILDLFFSYFDAMERYGNKLKDYKIIVIYTKSDSWEFPDEILAYLTSDPLSTLTKPNVNLTELEDINMRDYMAKMQSISDKLEDYTRQRIGGGAALLSLFKKYEVQQYFSVVSTYGEGIDNTISQRHFSTMRLSNLYYRVLDPLLWALYLNHDGEVTYLPDRILRQKEVILVYDSSVFSYSWLKLASLEKLSQVLEEHGIAWDIYYLGHNHRMSSSGQLPQKHKDNYNLPRLIGPILDLLESNETITPVVVFTDDSILDLRDFRLSAWTHRMLIVSTTDVSVNKWNNTFIYRSEEDLSILVDTLVQLIRRNFQGGNI